MKKLSYLNPDEFDALTKEERLERGELMSEALFGKTMDQHEELLESLIAERLKTMSVDEIEKMTDQAMREFDEMKLLQKKMHEQATALEEQIDRIEEKASLQKLADLEEKIGRIEETASLQKLAALEEKADYLRSDANWLSVDWSHKFELIFKSDIFLKRYGYPKETLKLQDKDKKVIDLFRYRK